MGGAAGHRLRKSVRKRAQTPILTQLILKLFLEPLLLHGDGVGLHSYIWLLLYLLQMYFSAIIIIPMMRGKWICKWGEHEGL